jgi:hypothetical protein
MGEKKKKGRGEEWEIQEVYWAASAALKVTIGNSVVKFNNSMTRC